MTNTVETVPNDNCDIIVVSDMHMGEGRKPNSQRYAPTEDFFHDRAFERFLTFLTNQYKENPSQLKLVLNGDIFDFLTVVQVPQKNEAEKRGFTVASSERKFGLNATEAKSIYKLDVIFEGHTVAFHALSRFVAAGHQVCFIRGNHDLELYFPGVRSRLLHLLSTFSDGATPEELEQNVAFHMLFYHEPGRIHIEHGQQFDSSNSNRYPLHPVITEKSFWRWDEEEDDILDYPIGSIFVKFFYNRVRRIDPYAPRLLSPEQYVDFVRRYNMFDVWRIYRDHYPYFIAALGPMAPAGSSGASDQTDAQHQLQIEALDATHEKRDLFEKWDKLKIHPESASKLGIVRKMAEPIARRAMWFAVFVFVAIYIWLLIIQLIQAVPWIPARPFLMTLFAVLTITSAIWAWINLRRKLRAKTAQKEAEGGEKRAKQLAEIFDVAVVILGHTHIVDFREMKTSADKTAVYANSGTWTAVNNPWNRIMRGARRMTFLHIKNTNVELKRWNDDAGRMDRVPLFKLREPEIENDVDMDTVSMPPCSHWDAHEHSFLPSDSDEESGEDRDTEDRPTI